MQGFRVCDVVGSGSMHRASGFNIGALITKIGFWGIVYFTYNKEP